jgi:hypothetical protein
MAPSETSALFGSQEMVTVDGKEVGKQQWKVKSEKSTINICIISLPCFLWYISVHRTRMLTFLDTRI